MSRFPSGPPASRFRGRSVSDGETLQTDVMRFMAILGLCLTAIFALVRTLPLDGVDARDDSETRSEPRSGTANRETQVDQLRQQLRSARTESVKTNRLMTDTRRRDRENIHSRAGKGISGLRQPDIDPSPLAGPAPAEARSNSSPDVDNEQGFSLRFESAYVLEKLIQDGSVVFFAMLDRKAWRLMADGNERRFVDTAFPPRFHEMSPDTVPGLYLALFKKVAPVGKGTPPVWGVHLPDDTEVRIRTLVNRGTGGMLVISAEGNVIRRRGG